jgi:AcrR family transcriptional regulator
MVQNIDKPSRGRPRSYDPDTALAQATGAFWQAGFSGTSLDALSAATGMNRPSLYGAFGDKRALYLTTLERYIAFGLAAMRDALDANLPLRDGLTQVYERSLSIYFDNEGAARGCFLIGTAATEAPNEPEVRARLGEGLRQFDRAFEARLRQAQAQGELDESADPASLASIASAILHTLAVRSRAGDSRTSLRKTAEAGIELVCGPVRGKTGKPQRRRS